MDTSARDLARPGKRALLIGWGMLALLLCGVSTAWSQGSSMPDIPMDPGGAGALTGKVKDTDSGAPIGGARLQLDTGQSAITAADGSFAIRQVPPGHHRITVAHPGYRTATGAVNCPPGRTHSVLVTMRNLTSTTPTSTSASASSTHASEAPREQRGTFYVLGRSYRGGYEDKFYFHVRHIEVREDGYGGKSWNISGWETGDDASGAISLRCDDAVLGHSYIIKITWSARGGHEQSNSWTRRISSDGQTETFYNP